MNLVQLPSPNFTPGRGGNSIDRIVLHWMDGTMANADARFADPSQQVSAHYGIEDDNIHQYVQEQDTAWHAGDFAMNQRSIGIEHSADPSRPASAATIETSSQLVADICKRENIPCDRQHIIKHSEVPYATECCGTLLIDQIVSRASQIINEGGDMPLTADQQDKAIKMGLQREPRPDELNNPQWRDNPGLLIDTLWGNGGSTIYANRMPLPGDIENFMRSVYKVDVTTPDAQATIAELSKLDWKDAMYGLAAKYQADIEPVSNDTAQTKLNQIKTIVEGN